jgi:hypothetical protein
VINVQSAEDGGIEGSYSSAPTLCYIIQDYTEAMEGFQEFFGATNTVTEGVTEFKIDKDLIEDDYPEISEVLNTFLNAMDYNPELIIDPNLIEQEFSYYHKPATHNKTYGYHNRDPFDYSAYDDDDVYHTVVTPVTPKTTPVTKPGILTAPVGKDELTRPTWRKTQTLGLLRAKGINIIGNPDITGDASRADVMAVASSMAALDYTEQAIISFFETCDYPKSAIDIYKTAVKI